MIDLTSQHYRTFYDLMKKGPWPVEAFLESPYMTFYIESEKYSREEILIMKAHIQITEPQP